MTRSWHRREHEIQKAIAQYLRANWPGMPFVGSVNGAFFGSVLIDDIGLAVKVPGARLQPRQQEWRTQMVREGAVFVVVHSLDEFVQALNSYLGNTQPVSMDTPAPAAESDNWADSVARAGEAQDEICDEGFEYGAWGPRTAADDALVPAATSFLGAAAAARRPPPRRRSP